jgi:hypothetical protein
MAIIDRLPDFIKTSRMPREEASRVYCSSGGILKTDGGRLIFPGSERLVNQLSDAMVRKNSLTEQIRFWHRHHRSLSSRNVLEDALLLSDPLFWEHLLKLGTEQGYRESLERVDLPLKYMRDEKYRKIIKAFLHDKEYRKRLVKAKTSIIGQASDGLNKSAGKNKDFKRKIVKDKLDRLKEERETVWRKIRVLEALLEWSLAGKVEEERPAGGVERDYLEEDREEKQEESAQ